MAKPCLAKVGERGVFVQTWSGDINKTECDLGGPWDVRHFVKVENLRLYPAKVKCKGSIPTNPRLIDFVSSNASDTSTTWSASIDPLGDKSHHTFSPCVLRPISKSSGTEIINTKVTIDWYRPGKREIISLSIRVTT